MHTHRLHLGKRGAKGGIVYPAEFLARGPHAVWRKRVPAPAHNFDGSRSAKVHLVCAKKNWGRLEDCIRRKVGLHL
jgi:hypothetical protein